MHLDPPAGMKGDPLRQALQEFFLEAALARRQYLQRHHVTISQALALQLLDREGPQRLKTLGEWLELTPPATASLVNALEAHRWAARRRGARGREEIRVALLPGGRRLILQVHREILEDLDRVLGALERRDRDLVKEALGILRRAFSALKDGRGGAPLSQVPEAA
jgi:DNA-binding MarR family transcriptional regulator